MSMVTGKYINTAIFYLLQSYFDGCHGNIIIMLPWQPYKWCTNLCKVMLILYPLSKIIAMATIVVETILETKGHYPVQYLNKLKYILIA